MNSRVTISEFTRDCPPQTANKVDIKFLNKISFTLAKKKKKKKKKFFVTRSDIIVIIKRVFIWRKI